MKNLLALFAMITLFPAFTQPKPGDTFREYKWIPSLVEAENGKFLRVGGRLDYNTNKKHFPAHHHDHGYIEIHEYVDLDRAIKAEVLVEKIGSHDGTKGLAISINKNPFVTFPIPEDIPAPQASYMHHIYPTIEIPLNYLKEGYGNSFKLIVDSIHHWNWPQNLIHGVILRVYYPSDLLNKSKFNLIGVSDGVGIEEVVTLGIDQVDRSIRKVDYMAWYKGVNWEGDGIYQQWHYHYLRGEMKHHIGTSRSYPYQVEWNTSWIPDQNKEIKIAAWVTDNTGLTYFTESVNDLILDRSYNVALCKPYDQPKNWVTRAGEFKSKVDIKGKTKEIKAAKILWTSWSPCYSNGIYINDVKVFDKEGPCYDYMAHEITLDDLSMLKHGTNIIKTGKEPLHDGQMVHGMEVQWPGIMLLLKYK